MTEDTAKAVKEVKAGRVEFKMDKAGNVHVIVGKASFKPEQIEENARAVIEAVAKARPQSVKGALHQSLHAVGDDESARAGGCARICADVLNTNFNQREFIMRAEKQLLTKEYAARLNASPFFIVVGYQGLKVAHFTELRKRLHTGGRGNPRREKLGLPHRGQGSGRRRLERLARRADGRRDRQEGHFRRGEGA